MSLGLVVGQQLGTFPSHLVQPQSPALPFGEWPSTGMPLDGRRGAGRAA
jgi:hypothetical protein